MSVGYSNRSAFVTSRRLQEAMDKLDKHHPHIASRLRTVWRREDEAWARGEPQPEPPIEDDDLTASATPEPGVWARWCTYWRRW